MQASVINAPAISLYLTLGVPRDRIAMVMTTVLSAYSLGLIGSNLLTGWLAELVSLRALFWMSAAFYALAAVCLWSLPAKEAPIFATPSIRYRDLLRYPAFRVLLILFWSSAGLMAIAMLVTVAVRGYFHANYLRPTQVEVDEALPRAA